MSVVAICMMRARRLVCFGESGFTDSVAQLFLPNVAFLMALPMAAALLVSGFLEADTVVPQVVV